MSSAIEVSVLPTSVVLPKDPEERKYKHEQLYSQTAGAVNLREIAVYDLVENQTGEQWFLPGDVTKKRFGYRLCVYDTIAGVALNMAHGIADITSCRVTNIYGTLQDSPFTVAYPIPLGGAAPINLSVTATNIVVGDPTAAYAGFIAYVTIEYVRDR